MGGWEPVFTQVYIYIYSIDFINKIIQKIKNNFKIKRALKCSFYQFVEKPPVKKAEGFCLLVVDKV